MYFLLYICIGTPIAFKCLRHLTLFINIKRKLIIYSYVFLAFFLIISVVGTG